MMDDHGGTAADHDNYITMMIFFGDADGSDANILGI
jgi:hypothetical protein